jgi:hypothetical protein
MRVERGAEIPEPSGRSVAQHRRQAATSAHPRDRLTRRGPGAGRNPRVHRGALFKGNSVNGRMRTAMSNNQRTGPQALIGKYVIATFPHPQTGIVEAAVDDAHYLVRFAGEGGAAPEPETLQVVAISDMARVGGTGQDDEPPPWLFFDDVEQRAKYLAWLNETPPDGRPRVVPLRPNPKSPKPAS